MQSIGQSFAWPFRGRKAAVWPLGIASVLLLPLLFVPLLGYAIAATRAAEEGEDAPPPWRVSRRLIRDGFWTSLAILLTAVPFALLVSPIAALLTAAHIGGAAAAQQYAWVAAALIAALPWGLFVLLVMPHATAAFASSGSVRNLFDAGGSIRAVRRDFSTWNLAVAAIVTGWAMGLACSGLLCVGAVPGVFYAILVSAHATAALRPPGAHPPAR